MVVKKWEKKNTLAKWEIPRYLDIPVSPPEISLDVHIQVHELGGVYLNILLSQIASHSWLMKIPNFFNGVYKEMLVFQPVMLAFMRVRDFLLLRPSSPSCSAPRALWRPPVATS